MANFSFKNLRKCAFCHAKTTSNLDALLLEHRWTHLYVAKVIFANRPFVKIGRTNNLDHRIFFLKRSFPAGAFYMKTYSNKNMGCERAALHWCRKRGPLLNKYREVFDIYCDDFIFEFEKGVLKSSIKAFHQHREHIPKERLGSISEPALEHNWLIPIDEPYPPKTTKIILSDS